MEEFRMKTKALLLGDYSHALYHPLTGVDDKLNDILYDILDITCTEDYKILSQELTDYKLVICYADRWDSALADCEIGGLVSFVARGGGLLVLHSGISLSNRAEFKSMAGAWFIQHPEQKTLSFHTVEDHPISQGIHDFTMQEEPYQYGFCSHIEPEVFMYYENEGEMWKSGWTNNFGEGKVVCLHPGHDIKSFDDKSYNHIIKRSVLWCIGSL